MRGAAGDAAAQAILSRPSPALPPRDQPAIGFSRSGPDAAAQKRLAREAIPAKALKRLKDRLTRWVRRAFDVVVGRMTEPTRIPAGLARTAYDAGLRACAAHPGWLGDPDAEQRAASRIARDLVDADQRSVQVVPVSRIRNFGRSR